MALLTCALGPDCAGTVVTELLEGADTSIDCAMYEVGAAYRWLFPRAAQRGVRVRLLLDAHPGDGNRATVASVVRGGGACRLMARRRDGGRGHWKLAVVDGETVAVGTGNLIWRDLPRDLHHRLPPDAPPLAGTREWWAVLSGAPMLAGEALAHLERAWLSSHPVPEAWLEAAAATPPPVGRPVPEVPPLQLEVDPGRVSLQVGGADIASTLLRLIEGARERALVTVPYLGAATEVSELLKALATSRRRGVDARLLLGRPPRGGAAQTQAIPVAAMDSSRSTSGHVKGAVVDGTVLLGSANWSAAGLRSAWEAALVMDEPAAAGYFGAAFLRDWQAALMLRDPAVSRRAGRGMLAVS